MKISYTIDINNTPEEVFHWLNNPERAMAWMSSVSKTELLHETTDMVGTTFREIVEENGQWTELHGVVTDYRPNQLIAFHLSGKFNVVDVEYRLEEIESRTRLTQNATIRFKSFMKVLSILMGPMFKKKIMDQLQKEFAKLKELCECGASS
jgi:uncharacterized protein YndB with AHSA1/START domain